MATPRRSTRRRRATANTLLRQHWIPREGFLAPKPGRAMKRDGHRCERHRVRALCRAARAGIDSFET